MTGKSYAQHFTEEQIERFKNDPNVRDVKHNALRFTYDFRIKLYEAWKQDGLKGIRRVLTDAGFDVKELGGIFVGSISGRFKRDGRPTNARRNMPVGTITSFRASPENNEYLLNTGKFVKSYNGIAFSEEFRNELFLAYPEQSVEDGLRKAGIDPQMVGYQRIYVLQKQFDTGTVSHRRTIYSDEIIEKYKDHPYVRNITYKHFKLIPAFFNEASFLIRMMNINEILEMYEISPEDISVSVRCNLKYKLNQWRRNSEQCREVSEQMVRIQYRRFQKLNEAAEDMFRRIKEELPDMTYAEKKSLCFWVQGFPRDPYKITGVSRLLKKIGISRSSYYSILKSKTYGLSEYRRAEQYDKDAEIIKKVMEYRGFRKGSRQICMMMKSVTGYTMSRRKVLKLMKKYGLSSGIREKKASRIEQRKRLEEHKKENLLKRRFRIARPDTHILTDVTYLHYGNNKLAYCSAIIDAVTGKPYDMTVRETNDLDLVLTSLSSLESVDIKDKAIFHSDQGALYLTDKFQNTIEIMGLQQSMSKRGNCWDNAPQESFFGHFKDECDYKNCKDIIELTAMIREYHDYFCNERRRWDHLKMTPVEYEKYLNDMPDEEFEEYLKTEKKKYRAMKKRAEQEAIERAKTLGV